MARTVVGYFRDRASASTAYDELLQRGVPRDDLSVLGRGRERGTGLADDDDSHPTGGAGAAVGGIAGLLLGAAAMLIPGLGPIVAVGPLSAALAGAVTGGVTGAVVGGIGGVLIDAGVDETSARYYDDRLRSGGYLVGARTDDARYALAWDVMQRHGGEMRAPTEIGTTPPVASSDTVRGE